MASQLGATLAVAAAPVQPELSAGFRRPRLTPRAPDLTSTAR